MSNNEHDMEFWMEIWDDMDEDQPHEPIAPFKSKAENPLDEVYYTWLEDCVEENFSPNPVDMSTVGVDQDAPKPSWVKEKFLDEIEKLKNKLFDLENRLAREMGGNGKWTEKCHHPNDKKIMSEIESIRKRIEKVSNSLGMEDEPNPRKK